MSKRKAIGTLRRLRQLGAMEKYDNLQEEEGTHDPNYEYMYTGSISNNVESGQRLTLNGVCKHSSYLGKCRRCNQMKENRKIAKLTMKEKKEKMEAHVKNNEAPSWFPEFYADLNKNYANDLIDETAWTEAITGYCLGRGRDNPLLTRRRETRKNDANHIDFRCKLCDSQNIVNPNNITVRCTICVSPLISDGCEKAWPKINFDLNDKVGPRGGTPKLLIELNKFTKKWKQIVPEQRRDEILRKINTSDEFEEYYSRWLVHMRVGKYKFAGISETNSEKNFQDTQIRKSQRTSALEIKGRENRELERKLRSKREASEMTENFTKYGVYDFDEKIVNLILVVDSPKTVSNEQILLQITKYLFFMSCSKKSMELIFNAFTIISQRVEIPESTRKRIIRLALIHCRNKLGLEKWFLHFEKLSDELYGW